MLDFLKEWLDDLTDIALLDGGTLSFTLAPYIEEAEDLIVIDAAELDDVPGTVRVFNGEEMDRFAGKTRRSVHEVSLGDLLAIAHLTATMPSRRALVAIQPGNIEWGRELTDPVHDALPVAARKVQSLLDDWKKTRQKSAVNPATMRCVASNT